MVSSSIKTRSISSETGLLGAKNFNIESLLRGLFISKRKLSHISCNQVSSLPNKPGNSRIITTSEPANMRFASGIPSLLFALFDKSLEVNIFFILNLKIRH